jgi:hypothetical protein
MQRLYSFCARLLPVVESPYFINRKDLSYE